MSRRSSRARDLVRRVRSAPRVNSVATNLAARAARASTRLASQLELHGVRAGEVEATLPNGGKLVLWSDGRDAAASRIWWRGWDGWEPSSARTWVWLAREARTVLDVGANIGLYSLLAGLANPEAKCFAFEPQPRTRATLEENLRRNPVASVTAVAAAVGARSGTLTLYWDSAVPNDPRASTQPTHPVRERRTLDRSEVPVVALDEWVRDAGLDRVDLIKVDTEYHEPEVLAGMEEIFDRHRPDLMIEIADDRAATTVSDVIERFGYRHHLMTAGGPIATGVVGRHPSYLNHLLTTRPDSDLVSLWR